MTDVCLDCMVCGGYEVYKGKPCAFCGGRGVLEISQSSLQEFLDRAKVYKDWVDDGGDPEVWDG